MAYKKRRRAMRGSN